MDINRLTRQQPSCSKALCLSLLHVDTRGMAFRSYLHPRLLGIHGFRICRHWSQGWFEWNPWFAKTLAQSGHFEKENSVWDMDPPTPTKKTCQVANIIKDPALQHLHMSWFFGHSVLKHIKSSPYVKVTSGSSYARDARLPKEISKHEHTLQLYN